MGVIGGNFLGLHTDVLDRLPGDVWRRVLDLPGRRGDRPGSRCAAMPRCRWPSVSSRSPPRSLPPLRSHRCPSAHTSARQVSDAPRAEILEYTRHIDAQRTLARRLCPNTAAARGGRRIGSADVVRMQWMAQTAAELVAAAKQRVEALSVEQVAGELASGGALLVDLREPGERLEHGAIPGAVHVPSGMLAFWADPTNSSQRPRVRRADRGREVPDRV